jgi:3-hydroxyisobutyrate dehydrogenase-like beta-hydroxyacid dehydrogenase
MSEALANRPICPTGTLRRSILFVYGLEKTRVAWVNRARRRARRLLAQVGGKDVTEISVIGLGLMGAALARAIHTAGHRLMVWNRSAEKMAPFAADGIDCGHSLAAAVASSPVVLVCIDNHASTLALFDSEGVRPLLQGRVIVQLTSSTPKEAQDTAQWMQEAGAIYLDGAILAGPPTIGTSRAQILVSGDPVAYERASPLLSCLGAGTVRYLGPNFGAASALDHGWLMVRYGAFIAAAHAAKICASEGVGVEALMSVLDDQPSVQRYLGVVAEGKYGEFTASLQVWREALGHIQQQGQDAGINTEVPDFIAGLMDRAIADGHGQQNVMAIVKALRP